MAISYGSTRGERAAPWVEHEVSQVADGGGGAQPASHGHRPDGGVRTAQATRLCWVLRGLIQRVTDPAGALVPAHPECVCVLVSVFLFISRDGSSEYPRFVQEGTVYFESVSLHWGIHLINLQSGRYNIKKNIFY